MVVSLGRYHEGVWRVVGLNGRGWSMESAVKRRVELSVAAGVWTPCWVDVPARLGRAGDGESWGGRKTEVARWIDLALDYEGAAEGTAGAVDLLQRWRKERPTHPTQGSMASRSHLQAGTHTHSRTHTCISRSTVFPPSDPLRAPLAGSLRRQAGPANPHLRQRRHRLASC